MSLQVWLPLTKDLRNQGLASIEMINNGATYQTTGKLGGCYYFASGKFLYKNNFTIGNVFSIAGWVNFPTLPSNTNCYLITLNTSTSSDEQFMLGCHSSDGATGKWRFNLTGDCGTVSTNTWYHVCVTYTSGTAKIYVNGILLNTFSHTLPSTTAINLIINGRSSNANGSSAVGCNPCYYNDIRIYDHYLSPMEVKELAKGLVLHYPLNRQGWGQENLVRGTYDWSRWVISNRATKSGNVATLTGSTADWSAAIHSAHMNKSLLDGSTTYVWSIEYKSSVAWLCYPVIGGTATGIDDTSNSRTKYCGWQSGFTLPSSNGVWVKYSFTPRTIAESQMTSGSGDVNSWFLQLYNRTDNAVVDIRYIKLEKGSIATPWCPNSSDTLATTMGLNGITEYDCSGFCNNGTRIGTLTWTSDTPKYEVSTVFNGTDATIDCGNNFHSQGAQELTFSCWVYSDNWGSGTAQYYLSSQETGGIIIVSLASSNNIRARIHAYTAADLSTYSYYQADCAYTDTGISGSGWHMLTGVYTTSSIKLYIDGILKKTTSLTTYGIHFNNTAHMFLAAECAGTSYSNLCNCKLSDVRIYATALSADDVKSLYQNSAYIDSFGNIYGAVHMEV